MATPAGILFENLRADLTRALTSRDRAAIAALHPVRLPGRFGVVP
jgi:hypothetical protein